MEGILLTRIAYGDISLDEIEKAKISNFDKNILKIAYYEKNNKKSGINFIKKIRCEEQNSSKIKVYNKLLERLVVNKAIIFDTIVYTSILNKDINLELKQKLMKEKETPKKVVLKVTESKIIKKETKVENILDNIEKSIATKQSQGKVVKLENNRGKKPFVTPVKKESKPESVNYNLLIRDVFSREVTEICKVIYVQMNTPSQSKEAVKAWDNFEVLIEKPVSDIDALKRMIAIISKLSKNLNLKVDQNRYIKYLEPNKNPIR